MTERVAFVVKGYPRLSETFIAQEIRGLEAAGLPIEIWSLRHPTDRAVHPVHREIAAPVRYLPEYLWREPLRVWRALAAMRRDARFGAALKAWLGDLRRDPTPNRVRRFGQALVLAHELPADVARLHAHFLHTPASVARYAAILTGRPWTGSAHAKDVWTTPDWEIAEKLADCDWLVTCSAAARGHLAALSADPDKVELVYHGIDLARFAPRPGLRPHRDGSRADDPVVVLAVGRAVEKKGFDTLIDALAQLPDELQWRLVHIGGGRDRRRLARHAAAAGIAGRVAWLGARAQEDVLAWYRKADLFVLPSKVARDGDRDGLPNVLMEAASQGLACVSTRVSAIPELIVDGATGVLVPPGDAAALAGALAGLIAAPDRRLFMGRAAERRVRTQFSSAAGIGRLAEKFGLRAAARTETPAA
ncbi:MAG: glycosyltransferase family 4 protein [Rhodospirillales bacterium]